MTRDELIKTAIKTVIQYAEEQGVKLRRIDFKESKWIFVPDGAINYYTLPFGKDEEVNTVCVKISYHGRWEKWLKIAKERFLNYFNARLEENCLSFSFTAKELEIIAVGRVEGSNDEKIETIIKKINKLLALSDTDKNNSEQEAISASLKVQKLLAKYNLSLADVTGERQEEEVEQSIADVGIGKKWKFILAEAVANNFACKHFFVGREQIVFYGYKADIVSARRVFVYLFRVGDRLANQYAKEYRNKHGVADGIYNSFCRGFVAGVKKELDKQCTALAIVVQPKVQESWEAFSKDFGTLNAKLNGNNYEAYAEGEIEGKRALNAQYIEE